MEETFELMLHHERRLEAAVENSMQPFASHLRRLAALEARPDFLEFNEFVSLLASSNLQQPTKRKDHDQGKYGRSDQGRSRGR